MRAPYSRPAFTLRKERGSCLLRTYLQIVNATFDEVARTGAVGTLDPDLSIGAGWYVRSRLQPRGARPGVAVLNQRIPVRTVVDGILDTEEIANSIVAGVPLSMEIP